MNGQQNSTIPATNAFTAQSGIFDALYRPSPIVQFKRERVQALLKKYLKPKSRILELNAGTGDDALWLAAQGHTVLATDASPGMLSQQQQKFSESPHKAQLQSRACSFLELEHLQKQTFDAVFSNFGGLNCTHQLAKVLADADKLLAPGGVMLLTIMPPNCLWEWFWVFTGNFSKAFRRWRKDGTPAHIEGQWFTTWYYKPSWVKKQCPGLKHLTTEALCLAVPPEHHKRFIEKRPLIFGFLKWKENFIKTWPLLRGWGDYFVIVLQKPG